MAMKKAAPKKAAPKNSTGKDQPVRVGRKEKPIPTSPTKAERSGIIKQARKVFGPGNYTLEATEGNKLAAMGKNREKGGNQAIVYGSKGGKTTTTGYKGSGSSKTTKR